MMDRYDAEILASKIRKQTGKHCAAHRTCETDEEGNWKYYVYSDEMSVNELSEIIEAMKGGL